MKRLSHILILALFGGVAAWGTSYLVGLRSIYPVVQAEQAEMEWLRREFRLTDAQFAEIGQLHQNYEPICTELCQRVMNSQAKLAKLIHANRQVTPEVEAAFRESAQVKEECQQAMLGHVYRVSAAMDEDEGKRYLALMEARVVRPGTGLFRNLPEH